LPSWYSHKEAYPYEWFNDYSKFESTQFPPREDFYSRLSNKTISEKEYQEALEIFQKHCKTFKDYHDIYLRGDVVLLAEVFEKYRELSLSTFITKSQMKNSTAATNSQNRQQNQQ
jgi:hypothetical protein